MERSFTPFGYGARMCLGKAFGNDGDQALGWVFVFAGMRLHWMRVTMTEGGDFADWDDGDSVLM